MPRNDEMTRMKAIATIAGLGVLITVAVALAAEPAAVPPPDAPVLAKPPPMEEVDLKDLAKRRREWPPDVKLLAPQEFPIYLNGVASGAYSVAVGTTLELVAVDGEKLRVLYKGFTNQVPATATDLVPVVAAKRLARRKSTVMIGEKQIEGVELAAFLPPNNIEIIWRGGSNSYPVERVPEEFRTVWGLTNDIIEGQRARWKEEQRRRMEDSGGRTLEEDIGPRPEVAADGSVAIVKKFMRSFVADPKSLEYLEWRGPNEIRLKGERFWAVQIRYRSKNILDKVQDQEAILYIQFGKVVTYRGVQ